MTETINHQNLYESLVQALWLSVQRAGNNIALLFIGRDLKLIPYGDVRNSAATRADLKLSGAVFAGTNTSVMPDKQGACNQNVFLLCGVGSPSDEDEFVSSPKTDTSRRNLMKERFARSLDKDVKQDDTSMTMFVPGKSISDLFPIVTFINACNEYRENGTFSEKTITEVVKLIPNWNKHLFHRFPTYHITTVDCDKWNRDRILVCTAPSPVQPKSKSKSKSKIEVKAGTDAKADTDVATGSVAVTETGDCDESDESVAMEVDLGDDDDDDADE